MAQDTLARIRALVLRRSTWSRLSLGGFVARKMRTGQVDVNGGKYNALAPFGGYKHSGIGREMGVYGLEEYLQIKSIAR